MLDIAIHATGSTGNCYTVSNGKATVMLDCGLPYNRIQKLTGFILPDAVFVTHEHQDHVKAAKDFMKRGVDIYTSAGTAEVENLEGHLLHIMKNRQSVSIDGIVVSAFETQHDAVEPLGFLLDDGEDRLLYATDTYYLHYRFPGLTKIMVEANYCNEILTENLRYGKLPKTLERRLRESHFSLENLKKFFLANDLSKVKEIWLIHLSKGNADPVMFKREIEALTGKPVYVAGID
jgi:phosphoribosyl 1,2-cyclic phosphodiesterase